MRKLSLLVIASAATALVLAAPAAATRTVHIHSSVSLFATLSSGKVSSSNQACVEGRKVAVKVKDARGRVTIYGRGRTDSAGKYSITAGTLSGPLPYKFTAVVKRRSEGTAGTIYVCDGAKSKTRLVSGG